MKTCLTMKRRTACVAFERDVHVGNTVSPVVAEDGLVEGAIILAPVEALSRIGEGYQDEEASRNLEPLGVKGD
jgi:hypothetical protein